jgi:hypothetical protein
MRADFLSRQKAWEAAQARNAPVEEEEEELELPEDSQMSFSTQPEDEVEEFLRDEDQELEALLELMPEEEDGMRDDGESLWSDDVDYEALFEQVLSQEEAGGQQGGGLEQRLDGNGAAEDAGGEEMDMS